MQFNKHLAFLLSAIILCMNTNVSASAEHSSQTVVNEIAPAYEIARTAQSSLSISYNTATCTSICTAPSGTICVSAQQTLQKFWGLWIWNDVEGASWLTTSYSNSVSPVNTKTGLDSGTYRLKTVFTLTASNGETETITVYSEEKTVS